MIKISIKDKRIIESLILKYGQTSLLNEIQGRESKEVIIEKGPNEKTWHNEGYVISLASDRNKYIVLLKSTHKNISYEIHIENESGWPITQNEKDILFRALYDSLEKGDVITSFGGCTPGGLSAMQNLVKKYGFTKIGEYSGEHIYWSSPRLVDCNNFNKWINNPEHKNMFTVKKPSEPLTMENTKPVIWIVRK